MIRTKVELKISEWALWRHSNLSIKNFPFSEFDDLYEELFVLSKLLDDDIIRESADYLDGGIKGNRFERFNNRLKEIIYHNKSINSEDRRNIQYASQVLLSMHFRNDTGKKGSLCLVNLRNENLKNTIEADVDLTANKIIHTDKTEVKLENYIDSYQLEDKDIFKFKISTKKRVSITPENKISIQKTFEQVAKRFENISAKKGTIQQISCIPISIDFFITQDEKIYLLEAHCPPRGIEMMFIPFRSILNNSIKTPLDEYLEILISSFNHQHKKTPQNILLYYPVLNTTFINRETVRYKNILNHLLPEAQIDIVGPEFGLRKEMDGRIYFKDKLYDLLIFVDTNEVHTYKSNSEQLVVPNSVYSEELSNIVKSLDCVEKIDSMLIKEGSDVDWSNIEDKLGKWIVAKEVNHKPWWSGMKKKCNFFNINNELHRKQFSKCLRRNDLKVEKLIRNSVDDQYHFGELRVFGTILMN